MIMFAIVPASPVFGCCELVVEEVAVLEDDSWEVFFDSVEEADVEEVDVEEVSVDVDDSDWEVDDSEPGACAEQIATPFSQVPLTKSMPSNVKYIPALTFSAASFCSTFLYVSFIDKSLVEE